MNLVMSRKYIQHLHLDVKYMYACVIRQMILQVARKVAIRYYIDRCRITTTTANAVRRVRWVCYRMVGNNLKCDNYKSIHLLLICKEFHSVLHQA